MLSWSDKAEIMELAVRYNHAVDYPRDAQAWADVFTEDGSVEINGRILASGRQEMIAYIEHAKTLPAKRHHWNCNAIVDEIEGDPDAARLRVYIAGYDTTDGVAKAPYSLGEYDDLVVRRNGQWRIHRRRLTMIAGESGVGEQTRAK